MGVKLSDVVGNDNSEILVDRNKDVMHKLMIFIILIIIAIVCVSIYIFLKNQDIVVLNRNNAICLDVEAISKAVSDKYASAKSAEELIGFDLGANTREEDEKSIKINGVVLNFKDGYYYLTAKQVRDDLKVSSITQVNGESYIVNYSTGEVINYKGITYNNKKYYMPDDYSYWSANVRSIKGKYSLPSDSLKIINSSTDFMTQVNNGNFSKSSYHFILGDNVDMSSVTGYTPITLAGTFDGRGYTISNLNVNLAATEKVGLFSEISQGATIKNLKLKNATVSGGNFTGALAGVCYGNIYNIRVDGTVNSNWESVGGVVGNFSSVANAQYIWSNVNVSGKAHVGGFAGEIAGGTVNKVVVGKGTEVTVAALEQSVGGFVGRLSPNSNIDISECASIAQIHANSLTGGTAGGFIGQVNANNAQFTINLENTYARGEIIDCANNAGGYIGEINASGTKQCYLKYSYTTVDTPKACNAETRGGVVGLIKNVSSNVATKYVYWEREEFADADVQAIGPSSDSKKGSLITDALTNQQIINPSNYNAWGNETYLKWNFEDGTYPTLAWENRGVL